MALCWRCYVVYAIPSTQYRLMFTVSVCALLLRTVYRLKFRIAVFRELLLTANVVGSVLVAHSRYRTTECTLVQRGRVSPMLLLHHSARVSIHGARP